MSELQVERFSTLLDVARGILALLQPLTGARATGTVVLTAPTGQLVRVRPGRYFYPVVGQKARPDLLFKTTRGPEPDGAWVVTDQGTTVGLVSNVGGLRYNLPIATQLFPDPPSAELVGPFELASATTGGLNDDQPGGLRDAVVYESMDGPALNVDLARSAVKGFPAVVVTWRSGLPPSGSTSTHAPDSSRRGEKLAAYALQYDVTVLVSRSDGDHQRRSEGLSIVNALLLLLGGRQNADGVPISSPGGMRVLSFQRQQGPQPEYQKFYVYNLVVSAAAVFKTLDSRQYADWLTTSLKADLP